MTPKQDEAILLPQHAELIEASAISAEVAAARGYRSVVNRSDLERLGFTKPQRIVPCLLVPIRDVHGEIATYQIRPDIPRIAKKGKPIKYETPKGSRLVLDIPPGARPWISDPRRPLFITEGSRKADAGVSVGLCCVAVLGVWNFRGTNNLGGKTVLADWDLIALNGREVFIAYDSDAMTKSEVGSALGRLRAFLEARGASVRVLMLPPGDGGTKTGLDDYLAQGNGVSELLSLATDSFRLPEPVPSGAYEATEDGLVYHKEVQGGTVPVRLTNFVASIVAQVAHDDGAEEQLAFELRAELRGRSRSRSFTIPARQFQGLAWVPEQLGAEAIVFPGMALRDHARAAIQLLSKEIPRRTVFTHLGWREIEGTWVYLHAGGAIGAQGPVAGVQVEPPESLRRFMLPPAPGADRVHDAIRASLQILDIAPDEITVPLLGPVYRSVLGQGDFSLHLIGDTGEFKTELAALAQQHFGAGLDAQNLPGSWSSTGNALEAIAFAAKDALMTIDDFVPKGSQVDINRLHREAERLLRAQGNVSGRQRMRADTSLRPTKPPRGLILSTGEEIPRGRSLRARMLIVEIGKGAVRLDRLTACQDAGRSGRYAEALSGYLQWLARHYDEIRLRIAEETRALRDQAARSQQHRRTPTIVAGAALGFRYFLQFTVETGALTEEEGRAIWERVWRALGSVARSQSRFLEAEEPTSRFFELLAAAVSSGRAHVASREGSEPAPPAAWGWREFRLSDQTAQWRPTGDCIGWIDGDDLFLEPEASFAAAQQQARDGGDTLPISTRTLRKRLQERGYLLSTDPKREVLTVRRSLAGARREVLHVAAGSLRRSESDQPDQSTQEDDSDAGSRSGPWSGSRSGSGDSDPEPDQETRPESMGIRVTPAPGGRVGRVSREVERRLESDEATPVERLDL